MKTPPPSEMRRVHRGIHPDDDIVPLRRRKVMDVLRRNAQEGGVALTTRRFNKILTDLGFRLEE